MIPIGVAVFIFVVVGLSYGAGSLMKEKDFNKLGMYLPKQQKNKKQG